MITLDNFEAIVPFKILMRGTTADNKKESEIYLRGMKSYHTGDLTVTQKLTSFLHLNAGVISNEKGVKPPVCCPILI